MSANKQPSPPPTPEPKWSRELPTEPGWYWVLGENWTAAYPVFVRDGKFCVDGDWSEGFSLHGVVSRVEPADLDAARKALDRLRGRS